MYVSAENSYSTPSSLSTPEFKDALSRYSMATIIENYGVPSQVLLELNNGPIEPNGVWHYHIIVFYEHLGFIIYYNYWGDGSISLNPEKEVLYVCPDHKSNTRILFALTSLNYKISPEEILERHQGIDLEYTKSLLETTGLSLQDFYDLFSLPSSTGCFESPSNTWH